MPIVTAEEMIKRKDWEGLQEWLLTMPAPEVAEVLGNLEKTDRVVLYHMLPHWQSVEVFSYLSKDFQESLLIEMTDANASQLLAKLQPDDRTALLASLSKPTLSRILNFLSPQDLHKARELLGYPEESVGRLMTPNYVAVLPGWTIEQSLVHIRKHGKGNETIGVIYVTDVNGKLLDALELERLVLAHPNDQVEQIMDNSFVALYAQEDREEAVRKMQKYDLPALPVVNTKGILLGVVTADDVFDVAEEEATEDIQKGGAVKPLKASYRESTVWALYQKRIPWLVVLMFVNLGASGVIAMYEDALASVLTLAFFIPLLMGSAGNTGSQAATLMVRALATEDLKGSQWPHALFKELAVGLTLGVTLGIGVGLIGYLEGELIIGMAVGLAMGAIVVVSNLLGILFPFILTRLRIDPALASSPMVTSTADVASLLLYFSIATSILGTIDRVAI